MMVQVHRLPTLTTAPPAMLIQQLNVTQIYQMATEYQIRQIEETNKHKYKWKKLCGIDLF